MGEAAQSLGSSTGGTDVDERLARSLGDLSRADSLSHGILSLVMTRRYDQAESELKMYVDFKREYPQFSDMTQRYLGHCADLIHAIKVKRNLPGLESLSMAKQQEIHDSVIYHFNDLKKTLKQIEKVEYGLRITDLRSTVVVVKAFSYCLFAVVVGAFFYDVYNGLADSLGILVDDTLAQIIDWGFQLFGL